MLYSPFFTNKNQNQNIKLISLLFDFFFLLLNLFLSSHAPLIYHGLWFEFQMNNKRMSLTTQST